MLEAVSYHAVIRYLERVLGLPVSDWLADVGDVAENLKAEFCCERAGLPVSAVRQSVLIEPVLSVIRAGFKQVIVRHEGFAYVVRAGKVVTIVTERMRDEKTSQLGKVKHVSHREAKRNMNRRRRRMRK
jgi:hypothetical protein